MKKICIREMRHIAANYTIKHEASGYRIDYHSMTSEAIHNLIRSKWVECEYIEGYYLFLRPTENYIKIAS
jgi:hypothetical protein